uniref:DUF1501 domain-containing protein n=1 Tax=Corethron hystrix TaxID=216773 RepID=A0A7S1G156_9STRA
MMAEMLTFINSQSTLYVRQQTGNTIYPDENFAREIMQLFSIGTVLLHMDGTEVRDDFDFPIPTYDNDHIMSFARAWTGFTRQNQRGNIELQGGGPNRMDPLDNRAGTRDIFPKLSLSDENFIGDGLPLCEDLPPYHFLKKGSKYRLLGSASSSELLYENSRWASLSTTVRLELAPESDLYKVLNTFTKSKQPGTNIYLPSDLVCHGGECDVETLRQFSVNGTFYEYIRPPCVHMTFFAQPRSIRKRHLKYAMCENEKSMVAASACSYITTVPNHRWAMDFCKFSGELVSYQEGIQRCSETWGSITRETEFSDWWDINITPNGCVHDHYWHWSPRNCTMVAKVYGLNGNVAMVHRPDMTPAITGDNRYSVYPEGNDDNINYFLVYWAEGLYPNLEENNCADLACEASVYGTACMCEVEVVNTPIFETYPTAEEVVMNATIGSFDPTDYLEDMSFDQENQGVRTYHKSTNGASNFDMDTVFGVVNKGVTKYFRNIKSTVQLISNSNFSFRNPPKFYSFKDADQGMSARDIIDETETVLDEYFHHRNVAPFISYRLIQRLGGMSNPSPQFVQNVAMAFQTGLYEEDGKEAIGSGNYGDMGATVAAIILDKEFVNAALDADPTAGGMKEPLLKLTSFFRAMEFTPTHFMPELRLYDLANKIGQEAHSAPSVFSYFLYDFTPMGPLADASLVAPEAQVLTAPTMINAMNGMFSFIETGITDCFGGFGFFQWFRWPRCPSTSANQWTDQIKSEVSYGMSAYEPSFTDAESIVNELDILLTQGRLSTKSQQIIVEAINRANSFEEGLRMAQKLIITTPEYHSTSILEMSGLTRAETVAPPEPKAAYKSLVYIMLNGGNDSFNMLVPYSGCGPTTSHAEYSRIRGGVALPLGQLKVVDAVNEQPCEKYGVHHALFYLHQLYEEKDALFAAGIGVLTEPTDRWNWMKTHLGKVALFAHNTQQKDTEKVDIFHKYGGTGIGGRIADVLSKKGFKSVTMSVAGTSEYLSGDTPVVSINPIAGVTPLYPIPYGEDIKDAVKDLNNATTLTSGLFGETWSQMIYQALSESNMLISALESVDVTATFPDTNLGRQMKTIAHLIKTRSARKSERDIFFAESGGWDMHFEVTNNLDRMFREVDGALKAFVEEMKVHQKIWDDILVLQASEFSRTTSPNTSGGTDHSWSGHYFLAGGSVKGGQIVGAYPDITEVKQHFFYVLVDYICSDII